MSFNLLISLQFFIRDKMVDYLDGIGLLLEFQNTGAFIWIKFIEIDF